MILANPPPKDHPIGPAPGVLGHVVFFALWAIVLVLAIGIIWGILLAAAPVTNLTRCTDDAMCEIVRQEPSDQDTYDASEGYPP